MQKCQIQATYMKLFPDLEDPLECFCLRKAVGNLVVELLKCKRTTYGKNA